MPDETDEPTFNLHHDIKQGADSFSCKHTMKICGKYMGKTLHN